jgi:hypothetical protein
VEFETAGPTASPCPGCHAEQAQPGDRAARDTRQWVRIRSAWTVRPLSPTAAAAMTSTPRTPPRAEHQAHSDCDCCHDAVHESSRTLPAWLSNVGSRRMPSWTDPGVWCCRPGRSAGLLAQHPVYRVEASHWSGRTGMRCSSMTKQLTLQNLTYRPSHPKCLVRTCVTLRGGVCPRSLPAPSLQLGWLR